MFFDNHNYVKYKNDVPYPYASEKDCAPFNLRVPISHDWKESKVRLLFVCGHVNFEDLRNGRLLSASSKTLVNNLIKETVRISKEWGKIKPDKIATAAINFNFFKNYHLSPNRRFETEKLAAKRVSSFIERIKPTHVIVCGPSSIFHLLPNLPNALNKYGWVEKYRFGDHKCLVTPAPDFALALDSGKSQDFEDDGEENLAGVYTLNFFCRCLLACLLGKQPWKVDVEVNARKIDTFRDAKRLLKKLSKADKVAIDTEGTSLQAYTNRLLTIQFAFNKDKSYVLPLLHKDSPFSSEETKYIIKHLRKFFMRKVPHSLDNYLLFMNAKYDLKVIRAGLNIPFIYWPVYDVSAGEHQLDENLRFLEFRFGSNSYGFGNLAQIFCTYGNDFYYSHSFSKSDRVTIVSEDLRPEVIEYAGMDAQALWAIHDMQHIRAKKEVYYEDGKKHTFLKDFKNMMLFQMPNNIHDFASMELRGLYVSKKRLRELKERNGVFHKLLTEAKKEIYQTKEAKKANKFLLEQAGVSTKNVIYKPWFLDIDKELDKKALFVTTMGLEVELSKKTGEPKFDKAFKERHKENPVVAKFEEYGKAKHIKASFVDAFARALDKGDGKLTGRIIPEFGFFRIVTGRSNSQKPSLQQIPEHGSLASAIKSMFVAEEGCFVIKLDYSAHEVRCWAITSNDTVLGELFLVGRKLRQKLFKTNKSKYLKALEEKGDPHKINASFFFVIPIKKVDDPLRQATKGVVFGAIYGRAAATLAKQLGKTKEFAEKLYSMFFSRYKKAAAWLEWAVSFSRRHGFSKSILGRRRRLPGYLTEIPSVVSAMERRAKNAPIQGMGADLGHTGARIFEQHIFEYIAKVEEHLLNSPTLPVPLNIMVHDSIFTQAPLRFVIIAAYILQWCTTKGVSNFYDEKFGIKFAVPLEVEMEFGVRNDKTYKWNWQLEAEYDEKYHKKSMPLNICLEKTIEDYCELYPKYKVKDVKREVFATWKNEKVIKYLEKNYPIMAD